MGPIESVFVPIADSADSGAGDRQVTGLIAMTHLEFISYDLFYSKGDASVQIQFIS